MLLIFAWCLGLVSFCSCITHWHVTESGRIESKEDSPYTLLRPYDLAAFLKQVHRIERLENVKEIISSKEMPKSADVLGSKSKIASLCYTWTIFKFNFWLFLLKTMRNPLIPIKKNSTKQTAIALKRHSSCQSLLFSKRISSIGKRRSLRLPKRFLKSKSRT